MDPDMMFRVRTPTEYKEVTINDHNQMFRTMGQEFLEDFDNDQMQDDEEELGLFSTQGLNKNQLEQENTNETPKQLLNILNGNKNTSSRKKEKKKKKKKKSKNRKSTQEYSPIGGDTTPNVINLDGHHGEQHLPIYQTIQQYQPHTNPIQTAETLLEVFHNQQVVSTIESFLKPHQQAQRQQQQQQQQQRNRIPPPPPTAQSIPPPRVPPQQRVPQQMGYGQPPFNYHS